MRKKLRFWTGAAFGAAIQYFYDPKAGQARRAHLRQRITDRVVDAKGARSNFKAAGSDNAAGVGRIDHLRLWRMEPRRTASLIG